MTLFDRHERCVGLRLWKSKTRFVQLWYCPRGYEVELHSHNDQNIELMYLFGKTTFSRINVDNVNHLFTETFTPKWKHIFRKFTVKAGQLHYFSVSTLPLVFVNFATFLPGNKPVSAAIDFHLTT